MKNFSNFNEIQTVAQKKLAEEFIPGTNIVKALSGLIVTRTAQPYVKPFVNKMMDVKMTSYSLRGMILDKIRAMYKMFASFVPEAEILNIMNVLLFLIIFMEDNKKLKDKICGNVVYPVFFAKIVNDNLFKEAQDRILQKSEIQKVKESVFEYCYLLVQKVVSNDQKSLFMKMLKDAFFTLQSVYGSLMHSIVLYGGFGIGSVILMHIICKKIIGNVQTMEIDKVRFNKMLRDIVSFVNTRFKYRGEYQKMDKNSNPVSYLMFKINNKVYENSNDVASQIPLLIKELLKHMPQNVFVHKIEYHSYDEDEALVQMKKSDDEQDADASLDTRKKKEKLIKEKMGLINPEDEDDKYFDAFDLIQTIYSSDNTIKVTPGNYLTSVDKKIQMYAQQHYRLYQFINKKTWSRKILFNFLTEPFKPRDLSVKIPESYTLHFANLEKDDPDLKLYFYKMDLPWFKHKSTIKNQNHLNKKGTFMDVYIVQLSLTKFVEKNLYNILNDVPKGLKLQEVWRPAESNTSNCTQYIVYPKKNNIDENEKKKCAIPAKMMTTVDKQFMEWKGK